MPQFNDLAKGVALGIGAALLIPVAATSLAPILRPLAREAIKAGVRTVELGREKMAEAGELIEDVIAETQAELQAEHMARQAAEDTESEVEMPADNETSANTETEEKPTPGTRSRKVAKKRTATKSADV